MLTGLHHVGRSVLDRARSAEQLAAITGWERVRWDEDGALARHGAPSTFLAGPNGWLELVGVHGSPPHPRRIDEPGVTHAGIQVGRLDEAIERIEAAGVDRHAEPVALGTGFEYLYVRDAEHGWIEVEGAPHARRYRDAWLVHGAISTRDIDRSRAAYEQLTCRDAVSTVRLRDRPEVDVLCGLPGVDVTGTWVPLANAKIEIWQFHRPRTTSSDGRSYETPGVGHLAFECDDIDADLERARRAGFTVVDEPVVADGATIARLHDPDANWIELVSFHDELDERSLRRCPNVGRATSADALLSSERRR